MVFLSCLPSFSVISFCEYITVYSDNIYSSIKEENLDNIGKIEIN